MTEVAGPLLDGIVATLQHGYPGMRGASPLLVAEDFVRRYIRLEVQGQDLQLLARLSPTGGRYNVPGQPATIMLQFMTDTDEALPAELEPISLSCGMQAIRDREATPASNGSSLSHPHSTERRPRRSAFDWPANS